MSKFSPGLTLLSVLRQAELNLFLVVDVIAYGFFIGQGLVIMLKVSLLIMQIFFFF